MKNLSFLSIIIFLSFFANPLMSQAPTKSTMGTKGYVEYLEGNMPLVISIPHDGMLKPEDIPDRTCKRCSKNQDIHTEIIGMAIREHIYELTSKYPYIIISRLHRSKLDPNRSIAEAASEHKQAEIAYAEFHGFIDSAIAEVEQKYGKGLYIDLHGHRHPIERVELGYLVTGDELRYPDDFLNDDSFYEYSSIRNLISSNPKSYSYTDLLRGPESFGSMLEERGYTAVPSLNTPFPKDGEPFFSGGFNTETHSAVSGGTVDGIQVEVDLALRKDPIRRIEFAKTLSEVLLHYLETYYFKDINN